MKTPEVSALIRAALREDLGNGGDLSTRFFVPVGVRLRGRIVARQSGVICGMGVAREVFKAVSPAIRFKALARDGDRVGPHAVVARLEGPRQILTAERTALNFLQRLSGVATRARAFAERVRGTRARVYDTRKTLPGWRALDKYAVRCGGASNHRMGLYDMAMLKDNHLRFGGARLKKAVAAFRRRHPRTPLLMEAKTRAQVKAALSCGADIILLDNMPLRRLRREIAHIRRAAPSKHIEVSGGVCLSNVRRIARLGPDRISVGALTHSAPALDLSLEIDHGIARNT